MGLDPITTGYIIANGMADGLITHFPCYGLFFVWFGLCFRSFGVMSCGIRTVNITFTVYIRNKKKEVLLERRRGWQNLRTTLELELYPKHLTFSPFLGCLFIEADSHDGLFIYALFFVDFVEYIEKKWLEVWLTSSLAHKLETE